MQLRVARAADATALAGFAAAVFQHTFGPHNTEENTRAYLASAFTPSKLAELIDASEGGTLVGEVDDDIVAYAMVLPHEAPAHEDLHPDGAFLQRFYLDHSLHGSGAADALLEAVINHCEQRQFPALWLTVWEHNPRAIRYYEKHGFDRIGTCAFQFGNERQTDIVMQRVLPPTN